MTNPDLIPKSKCLLTKMVSNCTVKPEEILNQCDGDGVREQLDLQHTARYTGYESIAKNKGCLQPCVRYIYSLEESYTLPENPKHAASIFLKYRSNDKMKVYEEVYAYDMNDFAEDVGGLSGLLLGASM